jgi:hypothetical protein
VVQVVRSVIAIRIIWAKDDRGVVIEVRARPVGWGLGAATGESETRQEENCRKEVHLDLDTILQTKNRFQLKMFLIPTFY